MNKNEYMPPGSAILVSQRYVHRSDCCFHSTSCLVSCRCSILLKAFQGLPQVQIKLSHFNKARLWVCQPSFECFVLPDI